MTKYTKENLNAMTKEQLIELFWQPEFYDVLEVFKHGAVKYAPNNWLLSNGMNCDFNHAHNSMFHHLAESYAQGVQEGVFGTTTIKRHDHESKLDPLLHLICRAMMIYTRMKRGLE